MGYNCFQLKIFSTAGFFSSYFTRSTTSHFAPSNTDIKPHLKSCSQLCFQPPLPSPFSTLILSFVLLLYCFVLFDTPSPPHPLVSEDIICICMRIIEAHLLWGRWKEVILQRDLLPVWPWGRRMEALRPVQVYEWLLRLTLLYTELCIKDQQDLPLHQMRNLTSESKCWKQWRGIEALYCLYTCSFSLSAGSESSLRPTHYWRQSFPV